MKLTIDEIQTIKTTLQSGKNLSDLTNLLNMVDEWIAQKLVLKYKPFSIKQVYHYYYNLESKYKEHQIPKKSGGERVIHAPEETLKRIQRRLNVILSHLYEPTEAAHGFVMNRSIVSNAQPHVGKKNVFNLDLQDFFPTIHFGRIKAVLQSPEYGLTPELAHIVANFCCFQGKLPQGSPVSPILTNIVCRRMDYRISGLATKHGFTYTRYADDITLSFDELSNEAKHKMGFGLAKILKEEGFTVNSKKTRLLKPNQRQEVTGVVVNEKLNVNRAYIRKVRAILHNWQKHGLEATQARFIDFYPTEKGFKRNKTIPDFRNVLFGKIQFLRMVRGKTVKGYSALKINTLNKMGHSLTNLVEKIRAAKTTSDEIYDVVDRFIQELLSSEIRYGFINNDEIKLQLENYAKLAALYESQMVRISNDESFKNYCRYIHLQMEAMINYFVSNVMSLQVDTFAEEFHEMSIKKIEKKCEISIEEFEKDLKRKKELIEQLKTPPVEKDKQLELENAINEINTKYKTALSIALRSADDLGFYYDYKDQPRIVSENEIEIILKAKRTIDNRKFSNIHRIPFANKFEYFCFHNEVENKYVQTIKTLTDYRNKVLSHSGEPEKVTKKIEDLVKNKNFAAIKEALIAVVNAISSYSTKE